RIEKATDALVITDDRRRYEALKREYYNTPQVSTESLIVKVCALLGGFEWPPWVTAEFDAPIPADAPAWLEKESEFLARARRHEVDRQMRASETEASIDEILTEVKRAHLPLLSWLVGVTLKSVEDVHRWCEGEGKDHRPRELCGKGL
ncbi:MAG: hypothetical protein OEV80_18205, partial [candidate division Zixibacteria bacterium]|nr:hypothetical protein [candidate division Zixibacteria bacterium]